jgi:hypothetical protein
MITRFAETEGLLAECEWVTMIAVVNAREKTNPGFIRRGILAGG